MIASFQCPVTCALMVAPVASADGHVYGRIGIQGWFDRGFSTSPLTNVALPHLGLLPLPAFKSAIAEFIDWKKASEEEKNDDNIEEALLRSRVDQLEKEKLKLDKERAGIAITQREMAHEYKELATLRMKVQQEESELARKRKLVDRESEDLQWRKIRLGAEIAALDKEKGRLQERVSFLKTRANDVRETSRNTRLQRMCDSFLDGAEGDELVTAAAVSESEGDDARSSEDAAGKRRRVMKRVIIR